MSEGQRYFDASELSIVRGMAPERSAAMGAMVVCGCGGEGAPDSEKSSITPEEWLLGGSKSEGLKGASAAELQQQQPIRRTSFCVAATSQLTLSCRGARCSLGRSDSMPDREADTHLTPTRSVFPAAAAITSLLSSISGCSMMKDWSTPITVWLRWDSGRWLSAPVEHC